MKKAWVVAVNMGYGHQRAAFALKNITEDTPISLNNYKGIPKLDKKIWEETRRFYEFVSKFKKVPILGQYLFGIMDKVQEIKPFYPKKRSLVSPTLQIRTIQKLMRKKDWGKHLIAKLNRNPIPLIATFPVPAFMAEYWGYKGPIYLLVTDSDAARAWAPLKPRKTRIQYLAPSETVSQRLTQYGIPKENIHLTGFPIPESLTNPRKIKENLKKRIARLDPQKQYIKKYDDLIKEYLGSLPDKADKAPLVTFSIGGAGAQQRLGEEIIKGLSPAIKRGDVRLCMAAGTHQDAADKFTKAIQEQALSEKEAWVTYYKDKETYFQEFTKTLEETDILWTKPSEMSFYASIGIPLILSNPIGSQEVHNRDWLLRIGSAIEQLGTQFVSEWLVDLLNQGLLAEAAMQGFIEMERHGTTNIEKVVFAKK